LPDAVLHIQPLAHLLFVTNSYTTITIKTCSARMISKIARQLRHCYKACGYSKSTILFAANTDAKN
jgi:hypothetical protein